MKCPACKCENPDAAVRCECGYSCATDGAATRGSQPEKPKQSSIERDIWRAIIAGSFATALLGLLAWTGKLLERLAPHGHSILEGLRISSPDELNRQIDSLLSTSGAAHAHDHSVLNALWIIVIGVCLLCLASAFVYVRRMQSRPIPSAGRTVGMLLLLGLPPIAITSAIGIKQDSLFQTGQLLWRLQIANTTLVAARFHEGVASLANEYARISYSVDKMGWLSWMSWLAIIAGIFFGTSGLFNK
jgi:hypothetical protein